MRFQGIVAPMTARSATALLSIALWAWMAACARTSSYVRTGKARERKPDGCEFKVFTKQPGVRHAAIGVVHFSALGGGAKGRAQNISEARERAAEHVCKEGGDAVILHADGRGAFVRATVIATFGD
jgi:hypothetical protein